VSIRRSKILNSETSNRIQPHPYIIHSGLVDMEEVRFADSEHYVLIVICYMLVLLVHVLLWPLNCTACHVRSVAAQCRWFVDNAVRWRGAFIV
jgi:hypothetical protein